MTMNIAEVEVLHVVGRWEHLLDRLHVKIPRALCGQSLAADGPEGDAPPGSRTSWRTACPACLEKLPGGYRLHAVPRH
jgi:hypothetical protein